jgi:hypothetical protein
MIQTHREDIQILEPLFKVLLVMDTDLDIDANECA